MKKGTKLRHYKGGNYTVLDKAIHTETKEDMVFYKSDEDEKKWARPLEMFGEKVEYEGEEKIRFEEKTPKKYELKVKEIEKKCDCCGVLKRDIYFLNGEEVEISTYQHNDEKIFFEEIIKKYNDGERYFELFIIETEDDESYIRINGILYKWSVYYPTIKELLEAMKVEYRIEEMILSEYKK